MPVKLSVIVPVYNTKQYLEKCVTSVLDQTLKNIEIILVDDDSPDGAGELCEQLKKQYKNIKVIHKKNAGLGMARNAGLDMAVGEYISFLDSDDYVDKDFYERLVAMCDKKGTEVSYVSGFYRFNGQNERRAFLYHGISDEGFFCEKEIKAMIPRLISSRPDTDDNIPGSSCMAVYNRRFLQENRLKFVSERNFISEDVWFNMDVLYCADSIGYCDCIGYNYRYNANSLSRGYNPNRFNLLIQSIVALIDRCRQWKLNDYMDRVAMYYWVNFEKCINQEVQYEKNKISSIRRLAEHTVSNQLLQRLSDNKAFTGLHGLLCRMLYRKQYGLTVVLLSIYNKLKFVRIT